MTTKVVLVLATRNRGALLERALNALQAQTFRQFEVRVYDNASTDNTIDIVTSLRKGDARIKYHRHDSDIGAFSNFTFGLERADGQLVGMISDDDVPLPRFLEICVAGFDREPDCGFSAAGTLEMTPAGRLIYAPQMLWAREGRYEGIPGVLALLDGKHPSWNTMLFRRDLLDIIGFPREEFGLVFDLEFTLRMAAHYPYVLSREPAGIFVRHSGSSTEAADARIVESYQLAINAITGYRNVDPKVLAVIAGGLTRMLPERLTQIAVKKFLQPSISAGFEALDKADAFSPQSRTRAILRTYGRLAKLPLLAPVLRALLAGAVRAWQLGRSAKALRSGRIRGISLNREEVLRALHGNIRPLQ